MVRYTTDLAGTSQTTSYLLDDVQDLELTNWNSWTEGTSLP